MAQNQAYTKMKNTMLVLTLIAQENDISRTQLAEATELSPASVTRVVNALISLGLVREEGKAQSAGRGRKAKFLHTCEDGLYTVGICIEPSVILSCLCDFRHTIVCRMERRLEEGRVYTPKELVALTADLCAELRRQSPAEPSRIRAAGISVPGLVDNRQGVLLLSDQLGFQNTELRELFQQALGLPVWIENDAKACLIGERERNDASRDEDMAYLLIGTGIGVAATSGGKVIRGCGNEAGEIEHLNLLPSLTLKDTLQAHLIEECILEKARSASTCIRTLDDLANAYRQNLFFARLQVEDFERYLRLMLSMIVCFYDPERIVLGGKTILKLAPLLTSLWEDERLALGVDYETACLLGASIGAENYALELLLRTQP